MQRDGVAAALTSPAVTEVLLKSGAAPVDLAVFEWSGPAHQVMIQPWVTITDAAVLLEVARRIRTNPRVTGSPTTAIGSAMGFGVGLLDQRANCWKRTLDISGDGQANTGPRPQDVAAVPTDVVINGLVIEVANIKSCRHISTLMSFAGQGHLWRLHWDLRIMRRQWSGSYCGSCSPWR